MIGFPETSNDRHRVQFARRRMAPVFSRGGLIAAAHPLIAGAGLGELARGGNAVDAAVTAALAAGVVMPEMCGLGGDLFAIVYAPSNQAGRGKTVSIHGSGIAPRGASLSFMREQGERDGTRMQNRGPLSIAVPGMVDAAFTMLERFGTRPFADLVKPAIGLARDGYPVGPLGAAAIRDNAQLLNRFPDSAAVLLGGGRPPAAGEMLRQPDLARTLGELAEGGVDAFYRGQIGRRMAESVSALCGKLSADDLADHQTEVADPISISYRDYSILSTGLPSHGVILLEALNIWQAASKTGCEIGTAQAIHRQVEAFKIAVVDRLDHTSDPTLRQSPLQALLSNEHAMQRAAEIDPGQAANAVASVSLQNGDTTYISVVDQDGMMVSLITSLSSAFGSGVVAGDTGMLMNNRAGRGFTLEDGHPNLYAPGKKTMHTLHSYLVAAADGTPLLVGGTPGGDGQPPWNLQTIAGLIDGGLDVQAAIEQPRWMSWPATDPISLPNPYELRIEDRVDAAVLTDLESRGHTVRRLGAWNGGGAVQVIARDPETGALCGGSDPRVEGLAVGL